MHTKKNSTLEKSIHSSHTRVHLSAMIDAFWTTRLVLLVMKENDISVSILSKKYVANETKVILWHFHRCEAISDCTHHCFSFFKFQKPRADISREGGRESLSNTNIPCLHYANLLQWPFCQTIFHVINHTLPVTLYLFLTKGYSVVDRELSTNKVSCHTVWCRAIQGLIGD